MKRRNSKLGLAVSIMLGIILGLIVAAVTKRVFGY